MTTIDEINKDYRFEQILHFFNIIPDGNNKILCPFHAETTPSFQVNSDFGYCFGCKKSFNNFFMAKTLLEKRDGREYSYKEVFKFFETETLPEPSTSKYEEHKYVGSVPLEFISYWESCMVEESYRVLEQERKITKETAKKYKIGWRPDYGAWSIPYWKDEIGNSEVDIIQFRMTSGLPKYVGMSGHNRGSVMNAYLLKEKQPYLVILFGAFDGILALQDNIIATSLNGCFPFRQDEKERVRELFKLQKDIFVVPDNNEEEFKAAYKLIDWIGGQVRYFPRTLPKNVDYIDYRQMGYLPIDFKQNVLELNFPYHIIENIISLLKVGDPENLARYHAWVGTQLYPPERLVSELAHHGPLHYTNEQWNEMMSVLRKSQDRNHFFTQVGQVSKLALEYTGAW